MEDTAHDQTYKILEEIYRFPGTVWFDKGKKSISCQGIALDTSKLSSQQFKEVIKFIKQKNRKPQRDLLFEGLAILNKYQFPCDKYPKEARFIAQRIPDLKLIIDLKESKFHLFNAILPRIIENDLLNDKTWKDIIRLLILTETYKVDVENLKYFIKASCEKGILTKNSWSQVINSDLVSQIKLSNEKQRFSFEAIHDLIEAGIINKDNWAWLHARVKINKGFSSRYYHSIFNSAPGTQWRKDLIDCRFQWDDLVALVDEYQALIKSMGGHWLDYSDHASRYIETKRSFIQQFGEEALKELKDKQGIRFYFRYTFNTLKQQYEHLNDSSIRYGVWIMPSEDFTGAFAKDSKDFEDVAEQLQKLACMFRIIEIESVGRANKKLQELNQRYNKTGKNKMAFLIIGGHGTPDSMAFSGIEKIGEMVKEAVFNDKPYVKRIIQQTSNFLELKAQIVLISCSTGAGGGLAQQMSKAFKRVVIAPTKPTDLEKINISQDKDKNLMFEVMYSKKEDVLAMYDQGKEINKQIANK